LCFLFVEIRTMDKVQKLSSNECYTPSSEPFRMQGCLSLREIAAQQAMCGSERYREAENHCPYHWSRRFLQTVSRNLRQHRRVKMTSNTGLSVLQTVDVQEFRELFDCPSYRIYIGFEVLTAVDITSYSPKNVNRRGNFCLTLVWYL
jgi:hypothetical protein